MIINTKNKLIKIIEENLDKNFSSMYTLFLILTTVFFFLILSIIPTIWNIIVKIIKNASQEITSGTNITVIEAHNKLIGTFFPGLQSVEYFKIFVMFVFIFAISVLLFFLAYFFSLNTIKDSEKLSQYECGFEPFDEATRHPFDVHFYVVGILFLIFDVEIALLFPWVLALKSTGWYSFVTMSIFLIMLTIGFFYEWHRGALLWPKDQVLREKQDANSKTEIN